MNSGPRSRDSAVLSNSYPDWKGEAITLQVNDSATMQQTTNGSMMFAFQNNSEMNNDGQLSLSSGAWSQAFDSPALLLQPNVLIRNWRSNNLNVTNTSDNNNTPIWIEAFGPGLGPTGPLPIGEPVSITQEQALQGPTKPTNMQLKLQFDGGLALFGIIGGPQVSGNNAYAIALNTSSGDTGPPPAKAPPPGYYATSGGNSYTFKFNWSGGLIYVAYFGSGKIVTPAELVILAEIGAIPTLTLLAL
jgi:hypothetical protein